MSDLGRDLDTWMRAQTRWVPAAEIEEEFGVGERKLRFDGDRAGLLSFNCISSAAGYKHVRNATAEEWEDAWRRDYKSVRARCYVLRKRRQRRREERTFIPVAMEITGQTLLFK